MLKFIKMHGCGNDFVFIDCFDTEVENPEELSKKLCMQDFGIGADGLVLILQADKAHAKMRMFNPDGTEAGMCGNAIRCVAMYLKDTKRISGNKMDIDTNDGIKAIEIISKEGSPDMYKVGMGRPRLAPIDIPTTLQGDAIINRPIAIGDKEYGITCVNVGNPHAVIFCDDVAGLNLKLLGPQFENNPIFPERINTEFVQVIARNHLKMRVWERGAEETLACGTGATAASVAAVLNNYCDYDEDVLVELVGGRLIINYTKEELFMTGGATKVFEGSVDIGNIG